MELEDIVRKLVGPIDPVGETHEDERRFTNLQVMCRVVGNLLLDIDEVLQKKTDQRFSVKRAGDYADKFFIRQGIEQ